MPTRKKPVKKVKKIKNIKTAVKQKQKVSVTVNVNSNNKRKIVATRARQLPSTPALNPIIQVPAPYNTPFMQTHGQEPIPRHEPVRVPIEPIPVAREIVIAPVVPPVRADYPDPMLRATESPMTPLPRFNYPLPSSIKPKPQFFTPVKETRANRLLAEAASPRSITPPMGVNASTSITRINLPQIREYFRNVRGFSKAKANSIKNSDKQSYLDEHGQAIQNYLNSLK